MVEITREDAVMLKTITRRMDNAETYTVPDLMNDFDAVRAIASRIKLPP